MFESSTVFVGRGVEVSGAAHAPKGRSGSIGAMAGVFNSFFGGGSGGSGAGSSGISVGETWTSDVVIGDSLLNV